MRGFADISKPLHKLTELDAPYDWTPECQQAFETLRHTLTTAPILSFMIPGKPFIIDTDASGVGLGAGLSQEQNGVEYVIVYYSRCLSKEECRYCVTRQELWCGLIMVHSHGC